MFAIRFLFFLCVGYILGEAYKAETLSLTGVVIVGLFTVIAIHGLQYFIVRMRKSLPPPKDDE